MAVHMLTTVDNPYDPYYSFADWYAWDERAGYHTVAYLARVANTSPELSQADEDLAIELAIDEIVRENVLGVYRKIEVPSQNEGDPDPALSMIQQ